MTEWRVIPSCPDYEASADGQIRRRPAGRPLAQHPGNKYGHLKAALWIGGRVQQRWVHRLVCEAFHGEPPSADHEVAHGDGKPANCRAELTATGCKPRAFRSMAK